MRSYLVHLVLLFLALGSPSFAQGPADPVSTTDLPDTPADDLNTYMYELAGDGAKPILLNCTVDDNTETFTYTWKKDDKDLDTVETLKGKFTAVDGVFKTNGKGTENESGNYTCYINGKPTQTWSVEAKNIAKLPSDTSVVEGQKLKLVCKLHGKPFKPVTWLYSLYAGDDANYTEVKTLLGDRVTLSASEVGVPNGQLVIEQAQRSDAGSYQCLAGAGDKKGVVATTVRVKGMYDALWPFLGICAEVVVLCAIILAYEKRRAKPELEDSDADNHEQ